MAREDRSGTRVVVARDVDGASTTEVGRQLKELGPAWRVVHDPWQWLEHALAGVGPVVLERTADGWSVGRPGHDPVVMPELEFAVKDWRSKVIREGAA